MRLFRKSSIENLAVTMAGVKLGDRLLVAGCSDPPLIAALAVKTGLTGRACAVDESAERTAHAARIVQAEGALIETFTAPLSSLPLDNASFDIVVLRDALVDPSANVRGAIAREAWRVLRPGGRCIAIETTARGGFARLVSGGRSGRGGDGDGQAALAGAQFRGVRTLADREGLMFVEGIKPAV